MPETDDTVGHDSAEPIESGIRVVPCNSWAQFISELKARRETPSRFRGLQYSSYELIATIDRVAVNQVVEMAEIGLEMGSPLETSRVLQRAVMERFKRRVVGIAADRVDRAIDENEIWALGRHHGLHTPLLDWSSSPYVAAFFAFAGRIEPDHGGIRRPIGPDVAVWQLNETLDLWIESEFESPDIRRDDFDRQNSQAGTFTRLDHPSHINVRSYLESRGLGAALVKYEIPVTASQEALPDLDDMNINYQRLFPDLEGAARQANLDGSLGIMRILSNVPPRWREFVEERGLNKPT
ncbi:MAG: FRG domain-containing protein [Chloroflexi bacterium]|nr:FRG domain-containing protein [Chloroflexota bacterium]